MIENILFVFEGEKTEKIITDSLLEFFIQDESRTVVRSAYKTNIYALYNEMKKDEFLDIFELVKDKNESLDGFVRSDFSQVFLFFDYDGHDTNASDEIVSSMISFFNEETENGKLFISYPMIESLKCIKDLSDSEEFLCLESNVCDFKKYKNFVHEYSHKDLIDFCSYDNDKWKLIIKTHILKGSYIISGVAEYPSSIIEQTSVFSKQMSDFLQVRQSVSVLGAFPLMILEYYGVEKTLSML